MKTAPPPPRPVHDWFRHFAHATSNLMGNPWSFFVAIVIIAVWGFTGPLFHFSDTWQLIINTSTTIITFLMVFLIQNTQNRDARAIHLKLDELIRAMDGARNKLIYLESLSDEELAELRKQFDLIGQKGGTRGVHHMAKSLGKPAPPNGGHKSTSGENFG